ncbi:MAG: hypothetical protein ABI476_08165 [Oxalobacteraceae bacterium]
MFTNNENSKNLYGCLAEDRTPVSESFFKDYIRHELINAIFIVTDEVGKFQLSIKIYNSKGRLILTGTRKKPREWASLNNLYSFLKSSGITSKTPVLLYFGRIDNEI